MARPLAVVLATAAVKPFSRKRAQGGGDFGRLLEHGERRDRGIFGFHGAALQQEVLDLDVEGAAQRLADVEQQMLRAARERIVADQQYLWQRQVPREAGGGASGGVQVGRTEMQVRLEIGTLAPFVPGIDADERLAEESMLLRLLDQRRQPRFIFLRCGALDDKARALPARIVIPARHHRLDQRKIGTRLLERVLGDVVIAVDLPRIGVVQNLVFGTDQRHVLGELVRRKLDRAVHAVRGGIEIIKALAHDDDRILVELAREDRPPARDHVGGIRNQARPVDHQERAGPGCGYSACP